MIQGADEEVVQEKDRSGMKKGGIGQGGIDGREGKRKREREREK